MLAYKIESDEKRGVLRQIFLIKRADSGVGYTAEEVLHRPKQATLY